LHYRSAPQKERQGMNSNTWLIYTSIKLKLKDLHVR